MTQLKQTVFISNLNVVHHYQTGTSNKNVLGHLVQYWHALVDILFKEKITELNNRHKIRVETFSRLPNRRI